MWLRVIRHESEFSEAMTKNIDMAMSNAPNVIPNMADHLTLLMFAIPL